MSINSKIMYDIRIAELRLATQIYYGRPDMEEYMNDIEFDALLRDCRDFEETRGIEGVFTKQVGHYENIGVYDGIIAYDEQDADTLRHWGRAIEYSRRNI